MQPARLDLDRARHPRLGGWFARLERRARRNTVVVALADKPARTAWVILRRGKTHDPPVGAAA